MKFIAEIWLAPPERPEHDPFVSQTREFTSVLQAKNWIGHAVIEVPHATGSAHIYRRERNGEETEIWSR